MMTLVGNPTKIEKYNIESEEWAANFPEFADIVRHYNHIHEAFHPYSEYSKKLQEEYNNVRFIPDDSRDFSGIYILDDWNDHVLAGHLTDYEAQEMFYIYGVCDNASQILDVYPDIPDDYVIFMAPIFSDKTEPCSGWRWHKWGPYIGIQEHYHEYLNDEPHVDMIYVFSIRQMIPCIETDELFEDL